MPEHRPETIVIERNELANRWRKRADTHDVIARDYRRSGDLEAAEVHEKCATGYRAAAEELEGLFAS